MLNKFVSNEDASVNWVYPEGKGQVECRFVQRKPESFVCYISSQIGCSHACRMCHLTSSGQNMDEDIGVQGIANQVDFVLHHAALNAPFAKKVHFNFMARGEPLASTVIQNYWPAIAERLEKRSFDKMRFSAHPLIPRFLISTIIPATLDLELERIFPVTQPEIYWSLYSVDPAVRKRWLPRAMEPQPAAELLKRWQDATNKIPRIHFPFIKGVNDTEESMDGIITLIKREGLRVDFNVVRYNPPLESDSEESAAEVIAERMGQFRKAFPDSRVKIIQRVGMDVKASCGLFATAEGGMW